MKKLILISALAMALIGCSADSGSDTSSSCNCGVIVEATHLNLTNGQFTTLKVKNNCSGHISTVGLSGYIGEVGQQYCNN
jgi:hypothetical protein